MPLDFEPIDAALALAAEMLALCPAAMQRVVALDGLEQWYAMADAQPPGYWDALVAESDAHPIHFGKE